jgi:mRNA interferase MazF
LALKSEKTRPAVVVSDNAVGILPLKVIVPITDWKDRYAIAPWMVRLEPDRTNGLSKPSAADAFQVRSVAQQRFTQRLGSISDDKLCQITKALATVLKIQP